MALYFNFFHYRVLPFSCYLIIIKKKNDYFVFTVDSQLDQAASKSAITFGTEFLVLIIIFLNFIFITIKLHFMIKQIGI
jgi:hypothetical protein